MSILSYHTQEVIPRAVALLTAPFNNPDMFWIITPVILTLILMQLYQGRYKTEEIGWNSAFGNTIALFFVTAALMNELFMLHHPQALFYNNSLVAKFLVITAMGVLSLVIAAANFYHAFPRRLGFLISSSVTVNVVAFVMIVIVFSDIVLDFTTAYAALLNLLISYPFFALFRAVVAPSPGTKAALTKKKKKEKRKGYYKRFKLKRFCKHKHHTAKQFVQCSAHVIREKLQL